MNQHVAATSATPAGPSNPIPNWRNPDAAHSLSSRHALLVSILETRVRSFLSSLHQDSPCAYSRIFTKYLQPCLEAHLRNHFIFLESDDLWEQLLGWRPLHTPESARAMGATVPPRFKFPHASLFGPSGTDYSPPAGPRGWTSLLRQDRTGVASTWAAIGVELGGDGAPVHPDYVHPAEAGAITPGVGILPTFPTFPPCPRPYLRLPPRAPGMAGSSANLSTSGTIPGGNGPVFTAINPEVAVAAGATRPSPSIFNSHFMRLPPSRPAEIPRNTWATWGWDVAETVSPVQAPVPVPVVVSSQPALASRPPTPPMPQSRSSSASPPPNPYALAEEASVLLEVFCQSLNENADLTQHKDLIKGARDNVNKIWDTVWGGESKGPARPSHDDKDPALMVYSGCVICYSAVAETVLLPCNHFVLCLVRLLYRREGISMLFCRCWKLMILGTSRNAVIV